MYIYLEYKSQESVVGQWLQFFFGLSFLDHEEVEECFVFDVFFEAPESEKAIEFHASSNNCWSVRIESSLKS
jgi:hypothetical protein